MKPVIGIPSYTISSARFKDLPFVANITQQNVIEALVKAGGLPIVFPISSVDNVKAYVDSVDAIFLQGGVDVDPLLYNEEPTPLIKNINPNRDAFEIAVIKEAWNQKKPIFGVCRGLQLLNVVFGGDLYQDLSYYKDLKIRHAQLTPMHFMTHTLTVAEDSFLEDIMGPENKVNSLHHQAIKELADAFHPIAWSKDGLVEAFESKDETQKVMAVQWHPEDTAASDDVSQEIFNYFVKQIKA